MNSFRNSALVLLFSSLAFSSQAAYGAESLPSLLQQVQKASQGVAQATHCPESDPPRPYQDDGAEPKPAKDSDWLAKKIEELNSDDYDVRDAAHRAIVKKLLEDYFAEDHFNLRLEQKRKDLTSALDRLALLEKTGANEQRDLAHQIAEDLMRGLLDRSHASQHWNYPMVSDRLMTFYRAFGDRGASLLRNMKLDARELSDANYLLNASQKKMKTTRFVDLGDAVGSYDKLLQIMTAYPPMDDEKSRGRAALVALVNLRAPRSKMVLSALLNNPGSEHEVKVTAARGLIQLGPEGISEVKEFAEHDQGEAAVLGVLNERGIFDLDFARRVAIHSQEMGGSPNIIEQAKGAFKAHPEAKVLPFVNTILTRRPTEGRELAYNIIGAVGNGHEDEVVPFLLDKLKSTKDGDAEYATGAFLDLGPEAAKRARPFFEEERKNPKTQFHNADMALILAKAGDEDSLPLVEDEAHVKNPRRQTFEALGYAGAKGMAVLQRLRRNGDKDVREGTMYGLILQGKEGIAEVKSAAAEYGSDENHVAIMTLHEAELLDKEMLYSALKTEDEVSHHAHVLSRAFAETMGDAGIGPIVLASSDRDTNLRLRANEAVDRIPREKLLQPVVEVLRMKDVSVLRKEALAPVLAKVPASQKEELKKLASDPDPIVREAAEYALKVNP